MLLSSSLLGTWAHITDKSSRSRLCPDLASQYWQSTLARLCCLQPFPVLLTAHCSLLTAHCSLFTIHYSLFKFQVSGSPSGAGPIRKGNFPGHRSLKRERGVGEHPESSRLSCLPRLRPLGPPISLPPNPSLALQASSIFVLIGRPGGASSKSSFSLVFCQLAPLPFKTAGMVFNRIIRSNPRDHWSM